MCDEEVVSGRNMPWSQKLAVSGGVEEYWPVRRYESIRRAERSTALPRTGAVVGTERTRGV